MQPTGSLKKMDPSALAEGSILIRVLVADGHCAAAMATCVFQFSGLEEVRHRRLAVRTDHCLGVVIGECGILGSGWVRNFDHDHLAFIAHHSPTGRRFCL